MVRPRFDICSRMRQSSSWHFCQVKGASLSGNLAVRRLVALIAGHDVQCDIREADDYDWTIAVCRTGDIQLNETMVLEGFA